MQAPRGPWATLAAEWTPEGTGPWQLLERPSALMLDWHWDLAESATVGRKARAHDGGRDGFLAAALVAVLALPLRPGAP
ncbi:MAG: hypothetical protein MZV70_66530 [Desulfobacterales bacterium]|nr:hypothetical protein [Desulfobacterales bacterium]